MLLLYKIMELGPPNHNQDGRLVPNSIMVVCGLLRKSSREDNLRPIMKRKYQHFQNAHQEAHVAYKFEQAHASPVFLPGDALLAVQITNLLIPPARVGLLSYLKSLEG